MKIRHRMNVEARCPVNNDMDHYVADFFVTDRVLRCEDIAAAVAGLCKKAVFQEDLTQRLADKLGCRVRTLGTHCQGKVETVVVCKPREGA